MHRALSVLFSFEPYATAFCVALATVTSNVALPERLPPAALEEALAISPGHGATSAPTPGEDEADSLQDEHAADGSTDVIVIRPDPSSRSDLPSNVPWAANPDDPLQIDRDYLVETATPGGTMVRQGPEVAIGRLHPEFVHRLAGAIREARESGLASAGIFSAYRPPAFGVGGFSDKFNSLHTYGLAVDMLGIGGPGSAEAKLWYEIAARHGVVCPYGFGNRVEWNHCQPTQIKIILPASPLRETVTADGPVNLESMFQAGNSFIENPAEVSDALSFETPERAPAGHLEMSARRFDAHVARAEKARVPWNPGLIKEEPAPKAGRLRLARAEPPAAGCEHQHRARKDTCRASTQKESGSTRNAHRQAAALGKDETL